ncbi:DUF6491 family protein [Alteraurantiacibacter aquimixticola]|uniref:Lipoprotein n=1 Tax=Alteraurantiacibacter aquimixticola TaxID=2489173 RepID=A0A4V4U8H1_9SPHN|nr:DUF6491 family protein [Alteraurantiacibacter aquimixticola]TIX49750.1 hypothetical protein E5222_13135 [Alteraurantiacibacter aquimixticola]
MIAKKIPALAAMAMLATACAQTDAEPRTIAGVDTERQCFFTNTISGYTSAPDGPDGEERLIVTTGPSDDWLFEVVGPCNDLDFAHRIAFDLRGRSTLCTGQTETLLVPSSIPSSRVERCTVRMLGKVLEEDEATAE